MDVAITATIVMVVALVIILLMGAPIAVAIGMSSAMAMVVILDVVEGEPITVANHPLFETGRIICSPHAAYNSVEAEQQMMEVLAQTATDVLNGKNPANIVNKKELGLV